MCRVCSDQRVWIGERVRAAARTFLHPEDYAGEIFDIDLVADAAVGRHHAEILECLLAPFEERVALTVTVVVEPLVDPHGLWNSEGVGLDRMVDHQFDRLQRIDSGRIAAEPDHGVTHRREIDNRGHAGKILEQNASWLKRDLSAFERARFPTRERLDVVPADRGAVLGAQQVFQQDAQRIGQARDLEAVPLQCGEAVHRVSAIADPQFRGGSKAVHVTLRPIRGFPLALIHLRVNLRASSFRFPWQRQPIMPDRPLRCEHPRARGMSRSLLHGRKHVRRLPGELLISSSIDAPATPIGSRPRGAISPSGCLPT